MNDDEPPDMYEYDDYSAPKIIFPRIRIHKEPRHFDWHNFKFVNEKWYVIIWPKFGQAEQFFDFDTEEKANEFAMLKKLEQ
jgi:hypothetical protein